MIDLKHKELSERCSLDFSMIYCCECNVNKKSDQFDHWNGEELRAEVNLTGCSDDSGWLIIPFLKKIEINSLCWCVIIHVTLVDHRPTLTPQKENTIDKIRSYNAMITHNDKDHVWDTGLRRFEMTKTDNTKTQT